MRLTLVELRQNPLDPEFQAEIRRLLNANCMAFTFHKVGTGGADPRVIVGTTSQTIVPPEAWPQGRRSSPPSCCPVYDIHVHAWRCFRWDTLMEVSVL